jgi:hypothetical protein
MQDVAIRFDTVRRLDGGHAETLGCAAILVSVRDVQA